MKKRQEDVNQNHNQENKIKQRKEALQKERQSIRNEERELQSQVQKAKNDFNSASDKLRNTMDKVGQVYSHGLLEVASFFVDLSHPINLLGLDLFILMFIHRLVCFLWCFLLSLLFYVLSESCTWSSHC
jgi:hypothetical protein